MFILNHSTRISFALGLLLVLVLLVIPALGADPRERGDEPSTLQSPGAPSAGDTPSTLPLDLPAGPEPEEGRTGRPLWVQPVEGPPLGPVVVGSIAYFVPLESGGIQVFELPPGEDCGSGPSGSRIVPTGRFSATPLALGGTLVWAEPGEVVAWGLEEDRVLWRQTAAISGPLAGEGNRVFVREEGVVRALTLAAGVEEWSAALPDPSGPITITASHLLVPSGAWMVGLDPSTGHERFRAPIGRERNARVLATGALLLHGTVYWGSDDRSVTALAVRGEVPRGVFRRWNLRRGGPVSAAPVPLGPGLVLLSLDNELAWVRAKDGLRIWRASTSLRPLGGPVVADGLVIVAGVGGRELDVFRAGTGERLAPIPSDDPDRSFLTPPALDRSRNLLVTVTGPWGYRLAVYDIRSVEGESPAGK